jgi:hypothetical protein
MSILDNPPHTATVFVQEEAQDSYGNQITRPSNVGVEIRCLVTPNANRRDLTDARPDETYRLIARQGPIGFWSRVVLYNGLSCTVDELKRFEFGSEIPNVIGGVLLGDGRGCVRAADPGGDPLSGDPRPVRHGCSRSPTLKRSLGVDH